MPILKAFSSFEDFEKAIYDDLHNEVYQVQTIRLLWIIIELLFEIGKRNVSGPIIRHVIKG